jgi:hypothetical protein
MKYEPGIFERAEERLGRVKSAIAAKAESRRVTRIIFRALSFAGRTVHKAIILVVNNITLTAVYFIGVTLSFLFVRLFKKDIGFSESEGSTWKQMSEKKEKSSYLKQF